MDFNLVYSYFLVHFICVFSTTAHLFSRPSSATKKDAYIISAIIVMNKAINWQCFHFLHISLLMYLSIFFRHILVYFFKVYFTWQIIFHFQSHIVFIQLLLLFISLPFIMLYHYLIVTIKIHQEYKYYS